jgi:cephalosporin-C deacetylase-like acetyl esterase
MVFFIVFLFLLLFAGIVGYSWYRLHKAIHIHATGGDKIPSDFDMSYDTVSFTTKDGIAISGWYIPAKNPKAIVILSHGRVLRNSGKSLMLPLAKDLHANNYSILLFDMRGTGESKGNSIDFGSKQWQDVVSAYRYVESLTVGQKVKIGFLGISQGGVASIIAAGKEKIGDFIIAVTPFATHSSLFAYQVAKEKVFPKFLFRWALQVAANIELGLGYELYNARNFISQIKSPIFLISGKKDQVVNPKDPWVLYESAHNPKDYWEASTGHDVYGEKKEECIDKILHFLSVYAN